MNASAALRISNGHFPLEKASQVESMLNHEFRLLLEPAIKKLKGNNCYHVGIDREKGAITNVSLW